MSDLILKMNNQVAKVEDLWVATFAERFLHGNENISLRAACMAGFGRGTKASPSVESVFHIKRYVEKHLRKDEIPYYKEYYEWIVNTSIFASCILTKSFDEAMEKAVVVNIEEESRRVKAACMFIRYFLEFSEAFRQTYIPLRKEECPIFDSMFLGMIVSFNGSYNDNHNPISRYRSFTTIQEIYEDFQFKTESDVPFKNGGDVGVLIQKGIHPKVEWGVQGITPQPPEEDRTTYLKRILRVIKGLPS